MQSGFQFRALVLAGALAVAPSLCYAQSNIGKAAVVRNQVQGILAERTNQLASGSSVHSNELIRSGDAALAELVLADQTKLSVGPKSEVRLDKFVYDPSRGTGAVVIDATRGAYRFITGVQDHRNYEIRTPYATLGVRGTTLEIIFPELQNNRAPPDPACQRSVRVRLVEGSFEARTISSLTVLITEPNTVLTVCSDGTYQTAQATNSILNFTPRDFAGTPTGPESPPGGGGGGSGSSGRSVTGQSAAAAGTGAAATTSPPAPLNPNAPGISPELLSVLGTATTALGIFFGNQSTSNPSPFQCASCN
jgi:hypothetical protein